MRNRKKGPLRRVRLDWLRRDQIVLAVCKMSVSLENLGKEQEYKVIAAGKTVLDARNRYPDNSLAELYDVDAMPAPLVEAHRLLDRIIDPLFVGRRKITNELHRQELLLAHYQHRITHGTTPVLFH